MAADQHLRPGARDGTAVPDTAVKGGPAYTWRDVAIAISASVAILAGATVLGGTIGVVFDEQSGAGQPGAFAPGQLETLATARLAVVLLAFQAVSLLATIVLARHLQRGRADLLPLAKPAGQAAWIAASLMGLIALAAVYTLVVYLVDPGALYRDVGTFSDLLRSDSWWLLAIVAVLGAPVVEEVMFRGLLFGVLSRSPAGPLVAALVTSVFWSVLHATYSGYGLVAIFLIGLYLAWLRARTGSLIVPIAAHSLYNGLIVAGLTLAPDDALEALVRSSPAS